MDMCLSKVCADGSKHPYSEKQLRLDNPDVSFPKGLSGVELEKYGVVMEPAPRTPDNSTVAAQRRAVVSDVVPMHCFLYGIREFGLRVQMEHYVLVQQGHARDYWFSAPYVCRSSTYVAQLAEYFGLSELDLDTVFTTASGIEE